MRKSRAVVPRREPKMTMERVTQGMRLLMDRIEGIETQLRLALDQIERIERQAVPASMWPTVSEIEEIRKQFGHLRMFANKIREQFSQVQEGGRAAAQEYVARPVFHGWKEHLDERLSKIEREVYELTGKPPIT